MTATTCDAFLGGRLSILQPRKGARAGIDAIFLAAAVPAPADVPSRVLEAGFGHGVAGLALAARLPKVMVTGVEVQPELVSLAGENARRNGLAERVQVVEADLTASAAALASAGLVPGGYEHVMANPPFLMRSQARPAEDAGRARAHFGSDDTLDRWARFLAAMAAPGGTATLIHRADALGLALRALDRRFGGIVVFPLFPRRDTAAVRVIVQGIKGSRAPLVLARGLVLHDEGGTFTAGAEAVLRQGAALRVRP